jgi:hypothetical protein
MYYARSAVFIVATLLTVSHGSASTHCTPSEVGWICKDGRDTSRVNFTKSTEDSFYAFGLVPNYEYLLRGYAAVNSDCTISNPGSWTTNNQPKYGRTVSKTYTATGSGPGPCEGKIVNYGGLFYTWTKPYISKELVDSVDASWTTAINALIDDSFQIGNMFFDAIDVDVRSYGGGEIRTYLRTSVGGEATVESQFIGMPKNGPRQLFSEWRLTNPNFWPDYTYSKFRRSTIPKGTYSRVEVVYHFNDQYTGAEMPLTDSIQLEPPLNVMGRIKYTQYNTPAEAECSGDGQMYYIVDEGTCNFWQAFLKTKFANAVNLNGTGQTLTIGLIKAGRATDLGTRCAGQFPSGANIDNSFPRISQVIGACGKPLIPYGISDPSSQALPPRSGLRCGAQFSRIDILRDNPEFGGVYDDLCPACQRPISGVEGHIDQYVGAKGCSGASVGDFGVYWTYL